MIKSQYGRKILYGMVISDKMDKTIVVKVTKKERHPLYKKVINKTKKFKAHDENNKFHNGEFVYIIQTRPLAKTVNFRVLENI